MTVRRVISIVSSSAMDSGLSMDAPFCLVDENDSPEDASPGKKPGLRPCVVRKVDDDRCRGAAHDNPPKRFQFRWVDFHVRQEGGDVNEIAGLCACDRFALYPPAYFAGAGEDVGDRLLLAMVMNARPRSRCDLEQAAPDGRSDTKCRRDGGATFGAGRLCGSPI